MCMNVEDHFECPKCGENRIEEVLKNAEEYSEVLKVGEGFVEDYGNVSHEGGDFDRFQCLNCGWKLPVDTFEDLHVYLSNPDRECKPGCYTKESVDGPAS